MHLRQATKKTSQPNACAHDWHKVTDNDDTIYQVINDDTNLILLITQTRSVTGRAILIHDLLFLPISTIESAVGKRLITHCCVSCLACSRLSGHIKPHSPEFKYYGIWGSHQKSGLPYPPDRIFRLSRHQCACVASRGKQ